MVNNNFALDVSGLRCAREGIEVVFDFNLSVTSGEVVALLGANGAGKTTAIDGICGFVHKLGGRAHFFGEDITTQSPYRIAQLGLIQVSQSRDLFSLMTVEENLLLGKEASRSRVPRIDVVDVDEILELFPQLRSRWTQRAGSLSGGEQQMLAIARALAGNPRIILLDEPTTGLAPVIVDSIGEILEQVVGRALTIVLVEQNLSVALQICTRFIVMRGGKTVFSGNKSELGDKPREFIASFYV